MLPQFHNLEDSVCWSKLQEVILISVKLSEVIADYQLIYIKTSVGPRIFRRLAVLTSQPQSLRERSM